MVSAAEAKARAAESQLKEKTTELNTLMFNKNSEKEGKEDLLLQIDSQKAEIQVLKDKLGEYGELVKEHEKAAQQAELFNKTAVDSEMEELKVKYEG